MKTISFLRQGKVSWAVLGDSLSALQILGDIKLKLKKGESLNEGER
jgi:hypothetical protein